MIEFETFILKFGDQGEKTGWTYIEIPVDMAQELNPNTKRSFRVKGQLDLFKFFGVALLPMGDGNFIMPLNADIRRAIRKTEGGMLHVKIEADQDFVIEAPAELIECLNDDPEAMEYYNSLVKSHRDYFIKWITGAKTEPTRASRIVRVVNAMAQKWTYSQMIRANQEFK